MNGRGPIRGQRPVFSDSKSACRATEDKLTRNLENVLGWLGREADFFRCRGETLPGIPVPVASLFGDKEVLWAG